MSGALLSTKFYIPPARADGVRRPRLTEMLQTGLDRPGSFILLSGPAGFGKTTLLSDFVTGLEQPVAWLSLDEAEDEPVKFWTYLIAACQTVREEIGGTGLELLRSPQPFPGEVIPTILINDLAGLENDLVLVLDDFHVIQDESIHSSFLFLLEHLPVSLHLLLSTRVDPPWPLARFRARNQLVEIRARDLRFTYVETAAFLNQMMGLELAPEDMAALEARTEGWIAGLQLAALSMQGRKDIATFIRSLTGSNVYVAEYLVEEVLERQPEEVQTFLLQTSILERLNATLCEAVTGYQNAQDFLLSLNRANLFVVPLDDVGGWFRYHHLFSDLLQVRARQVLPAKTITASHLRAADWFEQNGFANEAINHSLAANDFEGAARVIEQNGNAMVTRGELATLMRWIESLPDDVILLHPQIMIAKIWTLTLAGDVRRVEPLLRQAEAHTEGGSETPAGRELSGFAAAIRAFFAMMAGEDARALELAERADKLLPEQTVHARWLLPYTIGAAFRGQGKYKKALEAFNRQARMGEAYDNLIVWGTGITGVAIVQRLQGQLREVSDTCLQALDRLAERGASQFGSLAKLEVPLVEVLREQNELEEAFQRVNDVIARMKGWPMPTDQIHAFLALTEVQEARKDLTSAFETLQTAKDLKARYPVMMNLARSVDLCEIRLTMASGELAKADRMMDALQPGTSRWVELRDKELILLARLRLAQCKPGEAERILSSITSDPEIGQRKATLIETLALHAISFQARKEQKAALKALAKAVALAEPEGFVRVFVDVGEGMRNLLVALARQKSEPSQSLLPSKGYIAKLIEAFQTELAARVTRHPAEHMTDLVEPLTARELEVLQLVSAGEPNRAIAEKLVITISAVKKHTANIYGKLGVNSRTQAVARARQLRLLIAD